VIDGIVTERLPIFAHAGIDVGVVVVTVDARTFGANAIPVAIPVSASSDHGEALIRLAILVGVAVLILYAGHVLASLIDTKTHGTVTTRLTQPVLFCPAGEGFAVAHIAHETGGIAVASHGETHAVSTFVSVGAVYG